MYVLVLVSMCVCLYLWLRMYEFLWVCFSMCMSVFEVLLCMYEFGWLVGWLDFMAYQPLLVI